MKLEMPTFGKRLKRSINRFEFEVGIIPDTVHFEAVHTPTGQAGKLNDYAGGPTRPADRSNKSELTTAQIFVKNQERLNTNLLLEPFRQKSNSDIVKFTREFLKMAISKGGERRTASGFGGGGRQRVLNLLQAIVRNPILKHQYGPNTSATADAKGFDRHLFDTGKMFKSIKAIITKDRR